MFLVLRAGQAGGHGRAVAGLHHHFNHHGLALFDGRDSIDKHTFEFRCVFHRSDAGQALASGHHGKIRRRITDALANPAVFDRPLALARHPLLMQLVVEEGSVVADHHQHRNAGIGCGPEGVDAIM